MKHSDAERLNILLLQISGKLSESVGFVRDHDSQKSFESYRRVIAEVITTLHLDVQERLWRDHPELRPTFLKGPYEVDPKIHEPIFHRLEDSTDE